MLEDYLERGLGFGCWTIRRRLVTLVLTLALPLNLLVVTAIWQLAQAAAESQRTALLYTARSVAGAVDAHIGQYIGLAQSLANSPSLLRDDLRSFAAEAQRAFPPSSDAWLLVADLEGRQLFNTAMKTGQPLPKRNPSALAAQQHAIAQRGMVIADEIVLGPLTQTWVATMEIPVFKDGQPFRELAVAMKMQGFQRLLSDQQTPPGWLTGIIDAQGRFLARVPQYGLYGGQLASEGWRQIKEKTGVFDFRSLEGTPIVQGNAHPSLAPAWSIGIAIPKSELQSAAWRTVRWAGLLGGALSIASLMLAFFLARRVSEPIAKLRENVAPLLEGQTAEIKGSPEIDGLAEALRRAAADRKKGEEAAQQLAAIVRSSFDAIIGKRLDGTVTSWNRSAEEMFGYTAEEMLGQSIRRIVPPDRQREEDGILQRLGSNQRIEHFETIRVHKDGRVIPVSITISPMTDATGRVIGASNITRDITDQKSREEQLAFLLRELNHRSKNVLAVVQAIAHRTADVPARPFLQRFSERLQALSVNQDLLTRNDWHGIELNLLVKGQLAPFADALGTRLRVGGPSLRLSASAAQAIGMALHELATNASKYGALSAPEGTVDICWSQDNDTFSLAWVEQGGPPVEAPQSTGFGTFVLKTMAEQALGAVVVLEHAPSGLSWTLTAPLENVVDGRVGPPAA